jgi:hypothetical protein
VLLGGNLEEIFDEIALAKEMLAPPGLYFELWRWHTDLQQITASSCR